MQLVSIVIPIYRGEKTLRQLVDEIAPLTESATTPKGLPYRVAQVVLVHDGAVDDSARVMDELEQKYPFVSLIWLSRNFGQHPATLAGMASTSSEWVVTMDEDGQHAPADIGLLLDAAIAESAQLVYARGANAPPHGALRNAASAVAKWVFVSLLGMGEMGRFHSFRLVSGEIARSLAAYCGNSVYLDVALSWVVGRSTYCPVTLRNEGDRVSGYTFKSLVTHFGRMLLSSGTRPLRLISVLGLFALVLSALLTGYAVWGKLTGRIPVQGWTSTLIVICFFFGSTLFSLGVIAEYLGVTLSMAMGRPAYLAISKPPRAAPPQ